MIYDRQLLFLGQALLEAFSRNRGRKRTDDHLRILEHSLRVGDFVSSTPAPDIGF